MNKFIKYVLLLLCFLLTGLQGFSNIGQTTLNGNITNASTTITVGSTSSFPPSPATFVVKIDNEYILVSVGSSTTLTVPTGGRGQDGSAAAAHTGTPLVTEVLSAGVLNNMEQAGAGTPVAGNPMYWSGNSVVDALSPTPNVVYTSAFAGASPDPLHAAQAACPTNLWTSGTPYNQFDMVQDPNGEMEYRNAAGTAAGSPPWPTAPCTPGKVTADNGVTNAWYCLGYGAPSSQGCTIVVTPGNYTLAYPLIVGPNGKNSATQILQMYPGANINVTYPGFNGNHGAGVVVGNHGAILGMGNQNGGSISSAGGMNADAVVETWSAFMAYLTPNPVLTVTANSMVRGIVINGNSGTIGKAVFWSAAADGQADYSDLIVNVAQSGDTGILVSGIGATGSGSNQYNAVLFSNVWITGNSSSSTTGNQGGIGLDIDCNTYGGSQSPQLTWIGGVIDDFRQGPPDSTDLQITGSCRATEIIGLYTESGNEATGLTGIYLNNVGNTEILGLTCNAGTYKNCVNINSVNTGLGSVIVHATGACSACGTTSRVNNAISGATSITGSGSFDYIYSSDGTTSVVHP